MACADWRGALRSPAECRKGRKTTGGAISFAFALCSVPARHKTRFLSSVQFLATCATNSFTSWCVPFLKLIRVPFVSGPASVARPEIEGLAGRIRAPARTTDAIGLAIAPTHTRLHSL